MFFIRLGMAGAYVEEVHVDIPAHRLIEGGGHARHAGIEALRSGING
jgi:hypothetical protein